MPFGRPEGLEFPKTYYTFKAKSRDSDEVIEFRVQDLPDDRIEEALEMLRTHFIPDESMCSSKGVDVDLEAMEVLCTIWKEVFKQHLSIACFRNDDCDDLIGVNVFTVFAKNDPKEEKDYHNDKIKDVFDALQCICDISNIYEKYGIDQYLTAFGLCINRAYRGMGIATEMLKARGSYLKVMGLKVTGTAFTGIGSQIAAKKAGYEDYYDISYEDFKKLDPRFDFINNATKSKNFKMMALRADP